MRRIASILIVLLVLAALPLRGYAALALALCEKQHGGTPLTHHVESHPGLTLEPAVSGPGPAEGLPGSSLCSMCAGCCVGASLVVDAAQPILLEAPVPERIPFLGVAVSGHVPPPLARPPLLS